MTEDIISIIEVADEQMKKAISHLEAELVKIRAGKANPQMLDGIVVDRGSRHCIDIARYVLILVRLGGLPFNKFKGLHTS